MRDNRGIDRDIAAVPRKFAEVWEAINGLRNERRAASTTVSEGDFIVSGGGNIVVQDGGGLQALHANGAPALYFGPYTVGGVPHQGLLILGPDGKPVMSGEYDTTSSARRVKLGNVGANLESIGAWADAVDIASGTVEIFSDDVAIHGAGESFLWMNPNGDVQINPDVAGGKTVAIGHQTTAAAANCHIGTDGRIYRSTSSRRYKQDERPADIDIAAVLALQPRMFRSRDEVDALGDDAPTHAGFVAEEAAELGLDHWVTRDEAGEPESFSYSQFCVAQQAVIQAQQKQIDDLTARVDALTPPTTTMRST